MSKRKDRQYNDQKKKEKLTDYDLQNTTQKTTAQTTRTPLKSGLNSGAPEALADPSVIDDQCLILDTVISSVLIE